MDKANTIGMFISTTLMAAILGAISGLVWAFALSCPLKSGLFYGGIVGLIVGLLFFYFKRQQHLQVIYKTKKYHLHLVQ